MKLRTMLFVPGDRPERFAKAAESGADAIIIDLEDSVTLGSKDRARSAAAEFLSQPCPVNRFVRINPLDSSHLKADLACSEGADGIVLPKAQGASSVRALAARLPEHQRILPIASETPAAIFTLGTYAEVSERLCALTWGAEDLPAAIGAVTSREPDGSYTAPYEMVRSLTLFGAHAAGVEAIDTVFPAIRNEDGLRAYAQRAARDGFTGMLALHPSQVPIINAAFTPSDEAIAHARAVVEAFAASPTSGVLTLNGAMIDAPHLAQARRTLSRAGL